MDSSRLLDAARDPYARRQAPSMALSSSLASGQAYYTVESLEGAPSLPVLKPGFAPPPLASEREALLRLDAQKRALLADRETLDARARLLAAEREALLRQNVPDQRLYADGLSHVDARARDGLLSVDTRSRLDGLQAVDARTRLDGFPPVDAHRRLSLDELHALDLRSRVPGLDVRPHDELHALDLRSRVHGLDVRPHDALWPGLDDRARSLGPAGGLAFGAQDHRSLSERTHARELSAGARSGAAPFLLSENYLHGRRDIADGRAPAILLDSALSRRDISSRPSASSFKPQSERPFRYGKQEPAASRPPVEAARKQNRSVTIEKTPPAKPKTKPPPEKSVADEKTAPVKLKTKPPPEQSEGWCALCEIDCHNIKTLNHHLGGRRHKAMVEGNSAKVNEEALAEGKSNPAAKNNQADRKRASDAKPEASQSAKRPKTLTVAVGNGAPANTPDKKEKASKTPVAKTGKDNPLACKACNISVTGQKNLELHLKGKRHAARLKELAADS